MSGGSPIEYQADEQAGVEWLSWQVSGRRAGRCRGAQLASIRQMSRQLSRGSAGEYQADEDLISINILEDALYYTFNIFTAHLLVCNFYNF